MEAGGDQLIDGRVRQQVAGDLLDRELVERHVAIQRIDHPVAILPHLARRVDGVAVGIGVARHIEPVAAPALAVVRRSEQSVDHALIGVGPRVGKEVANLARRRDEAGQIEADPAQQRLLGRLGRRLQMLFLQTRQDEGVDRIPHPGCVFTGGGATRLTG